MVRAPANDLPLSHAVAMHDLTGIRLRLFGDASAGVPVSALTIAAGGGDVETMRGLLLLLGALDHQVISGSGVAVLPFCGASHAGDKLAYGLSWKSVCV